MKTVTIFSPSSWSEPKRLRKQIAEIISQEVNVIYVTLPYAFNRPTQSSIETIGNITVIQIAGPPVPLSKILSTPALGKLYTVYLKWKLNKYSPLIRKSDAILSFVHSYPYLLNIAPRAKKIYVANDDHSAIAMNDRIKNKIKEDEINTISQCDKILTVSSKIGEKFKELKKPIAVIYPGHDSLPLSTSDLKIKKVRLKSACFMGYIDWRIDFDLINNILIKGWDLTLIGPVVGVENKINELKAEFGEKFIIKKPIDSITAPSILSNYEVLILPYKFKTDAQRDAIELPNKLFIYLSALRPIVSTYMPNLKLVKPGIVYMATPHTDFFNLCEIAASENCIDFAMKRRELAIENTWSKRKVFILNLLENK